VVSGTGGCMGWQYPVLLLVLIVQTFTVLILLLFSHYWANTALLSWLLSFTCALPSFNCTIPTAHPTWASPDITSLILLARLFGRNFLQAATSAKEALKHSKMVYLLCKFHLHAHNPWLVIGLKSLKLIISCAIWNGFPKSSCIFSCKKLCKIDRVENFVKLKVAAKNWMWW